MTKLVIYECEAGLDELLHQLNTARAGNLLVSVLPTKTEPRGTTPADSYPVEVTKAVLRFDDYETYEHYASRLNLPELTSEEYDQ